VSEFHPKIHQNQCQKDAERRYTIISGYRTSTTLIFLTSSGEKIPNWISWIVLSAALEWFTILLFEPELASGDRDMVDDYDGISNLSRSCGNPGGDGIIEYTSRQ
jgi:hypothetical protein